MKWLLKLARLIGPKPNEVAVIPQPPEPTQINIRRMCGWGLEVRDEHLATILGTERKKIIGGGDRLYWFYRVRFPDGTERCIALEDVKRGPDNTLTYDE